MSLGGRGAGLPGPPDSSATRHVDAVCGTASTRSCRPFSGTVSGGEGRVTSSSATCRPRCHP